MAHAVLYVERFGLSVLPMGEDKKPLVKWMEFQYRRPAMREILSWPRENLAIITGAISGIVVVDCESREDAEWFYRNRGKSPSVVQTRRGFHLYFKHPGKHVKNAIKVDDRYDVRGDGGYVLAPPSLHFEGQYRWATPMQAPSTLPEFDPAWRPETKSDQTYDKVVSDGPAYIAHIRAVSGSRGHSDTYRAACILRESGLSEAEAFLALQSWNKTNADPPWSDRDLLHKVKEAFE